MTKGIRRFNELTQGKLQGLVNVMDRYPDGSLRQRLRIGTRLLTPGKGDRDIFWLSEGFVRASTEVMGHGPPYTPLGAAGTLGVAARLYMVKYGILPLSGLFAYTQIERFFT